MTRTLIWTIVVLFLALEHAAAQATYSSDDTGHKVLGSYFATDIDSVSLKNGNLHVEIPLFSLPGRELPLSVGVSYDSRFVEMRSYIDDFGETNYHYEFFGWRKTSAVGGILTGSKTLLNPTCNPNYGCYTRNWTITVQWIKSDGTAHGWSKSVQQQYSGGSFVPAESTLLDNQTFDSTDSEFIHVETGDYFNPSPPGGANAKVMFKDGTRMIFYAGGSREIVTLNGNKLVANMSTSAYAYQNTPEEEVPLYTSYLNDFIPTSDTTGRSIGYSGGSTETITLTDANNQSKVYQVNWGNVVGRYPMYHPTNYAVSYRVIQSIVLPNNKSYQFQYDASGNLSKIILPSGGYIRYTYGEAPAFNGYKVSQRIVSADGTSGSEKVRSYSYNYTMETVCCFWNPYDETWDEEQYYWLTTADITDPTGAIQRHTFATSFCGYGCYAVGTDYRTSVIQNGVTLKQIDTTWSTGSNPNREVIQTTMGNKVSKVSYSYDIYNNVTQQNNYDFGTTTPGPRLSYITRTYLGGSYASANIFNRVATEKLYADNGTLILQSEYEYDNYTAQPWVTRSGTIPGWVDPSTNLRANVTGIKRWLNTTSSWLTTGQQYDVLGNVVKTTDPLNNTTNFDFTDNFSDSVNRNSFAYVTKLTNVLNQYTTTKYEFKTGLPVLTTDLRGFQTTTTYDKMNRVTSVTEPNNKQTTYVYDDTNRIATKEVTVDVSGNKGRVKTYFDGLYRVIQNRTNDPDGEIAVDIEYDGVGRVRRVSNPYRASGAASAWTYTAYDGMGRIVCTSTSTASTSPCDSGGPIDAKVQYLFTGNQTTTINEAGNQRRYTYSGLGKLVQVEEPNPALDTPLITTYTYELTGQLKQTNQSGQTRTLTHDSLGRETQEVLPESGTTNFTYDSNGRMLTATDARGVVATYTYDALGRATQRSYSDGTPTVMFTYDQNGYTGLRTSMTDALGSVSYTYDTMNRLNQESRTLTGVSGTFSTSYGYNINGNLTQMTYPSGRVVNFNYATGSGASNFRLAGMDVVVSSTTSTVANNMTFDPSGALLTRTLNPNGSVPTIETFSYNHRMQQTQVRAAQASTFVMDFSYNYGTSNNVGQLLSRTDAIQNEHSVEYGYDSIYRLSQVAATNGSWGISWTLDVWSNRLTQAAHGYVATANIVGSQTLAYTNNRLSGIT